MACVVLHSNRQSHGARAVRVIQTSVCGDVWRSSRQWLPQLHHFSKPEHWHTSEWCSTYCGLQDFLWYARSGSMWSVCMGKHRQSFKFIAGASSSDCCSGTGCGPVYCVLNFILGS